MTEIGPATQDFVLHWGEMSSRWGINRSVAQIHALLYLSEDPLRADEIGVALSLARSNVSTSLRELRAWGLAKVVHRLGDRRDYFESTKDVWEMFRVILEQRKRRELDPTIEMLRARLEAVDREGSEHGYSRKRMSEMLATLETVASWYEQMSKLPETAQKKVFQMGGRLGRLTG